jgi:hypothetical protein
MSEITQVLMKRLARKGLDTTSIPVYIRDVCNILSGGKYVDLQKLNQWLQLMGWGDSELDSYTLQLIEAHFENDEISPELGKTFDCKTHSLHTH